MAVNKVICGGDTLIDLSGDTVTAQQLLSGVTAHDRAGNPITGSYERVSLQINANSDGCSSSLLSFACPFPPTSVMAVFNSFNFEENAVASLWAEPSAYCSICVDTKYFIGNYYSLVRTEITSGVSSYYWYSGGRVYLKAPSGYHFSTSNYRVMAFR